MKEHPIIFSTPMVQAILEGRKTQTRRIIKPQPIIDQDSGSVFDGKYRKQYNIHDWQDAFIDDWSRWMPEDILWVRETWGWVPTGKGEKIGYLATHDKPMHNKWKPSIHMFKEVARIWLEVTDIRVERLQDISEGDAIAEGVEKILSIEGQYANIKAGTILYKNYPFDFQQGCFVFAKDSYESLWQKINGEESWNENPFVWVIEFKVLSKTWKPTNILQESIPS